MAFKVTLSLRKCKIWFYHTNLKKALFIIKQNIYNLQAGEKDHTFPYYCVIVKKKIPSVHPVAIQKFSSHTCVPRENKYSSWPAKYTLWWKEYLNSIWTQTLIIQWNFFTVISVCLTFIYFIWAQYSSCGRFMMSRSHDRAVLIWSVDTYLISICPKRPILGYWTNMWQGRCFSNKELQKKIIHARYTFFSKVFIRGADLNDGLLQQIQPKVPGGHCSSSIQEPKKILIYIFITVKFIFKK